MGAYIIKCDEVIYDENKNVVKLLCSADLETGGKNPSDGRKVKGTIHWVSKAHSIEKEVRLYNNLFTIEDTNAIPEDKTYNDYLNPESLIVKKGAKLEASLADAKEAEKFQFVRTGYFCVDIHDKNVMNRVVTLKDSFKKTLAK